MAKIIIFGILICIAISLFEIIILYLILRKKTTMAQGEQKPTDTCDSSTINGKEFLASEKRDFGYFSKSADKVEHKFKVGDEIKTANEEPLTITKIDEKGYWSEDLFICGFDEECCWDLVEQKSSWSEEDEERINNLCHFLDEYGEQYYGALTLDGTIGWLKSLKDRVQQRQE